MPWLLTGLDDYFLLLVLVLFYIKVACLQVLCGQATLRLIPLSNFSTFLKEKQFDTDICFHTVKKTDKNRAEEGLV